MVNKVEICGVNTSKLPILKNEEKEILFQNIVVKKGFIHIISKDITR